MPKKLRRDPIYIAPDIKGYINDRGNPIVIDERNDNSRLNVININDKIFIYKRQVEDWFLNPALNLIRFRNKNKGFIVLMICLSYIEGIEQYRRGKSSERHSREFFVASMQRLYPNQFRNCSLSSFYSEARCGLFHNGMVQGRIIICNEYENVLEFDNDDIKVNPKMFLNDIRTDFESYLNELQENHDLRTKFDRMFFNL